MSLELYKTFFWPLLVAISLSKPVSDYFWLRKFQHKNGVFFSLKKLVTRLSRKKYTIMLIFGLLFWAATFLAIKYIPNDLSHITLFIILFFTIIFIAITILAIKSILVVGLIIVTFANFLLVQLFLPLTSVNDLGTLNNLLSNLISTFNYAAIATAAVGLVWQFGRHNNENVYGTISTMFYAIGYILLNMFISFLYLFLPTISQIKSLT